MLQQSVYQNIKEIMINIGYRVSNQKTIKGIPMNISNKSFDSFIAHY